MLRHIRHNEIYWYCPSCHQEMPNIMILVKEIQFLSHNAPQKKKLALV